MMTLNKRIKQSKEFVRIPNIFFQLGELAEMCRHQAIEKGCGCLSDRIEAGHRRRLPLAGEPQHKSSGRVEGDVVR
jgi:hypothetical protein